MRARYQKAFVAKHGIKLGLMSPFIKAAAFALQQRPVVNAGMFILLHLIFSAEMYCKYKFLIF